MKAAVTTCLLFSLLANAAVGAVKRAVRSAVMDSNFDDRTASPLPEVNAVGVYNGINYKAFDLINLQSPTSGSGVHSNPNGIATTLVTSQATRGTPTLTVDYPGSKSLYFDFLSFYFGCVTPTGQGAAQLAVGCSVLVAAFDAANKEKASAIFTFTPPATNLVKPPMIQAVLPSTFVGLHNATVVQSSPTTQVLLLDNVKIRLSTSS